MIVTKFVGDNRNYLRQYESTYCLVLNAAVNVQKNDAMFDALRTVGVILLIRDVSFHTIVEMFVFGSRTSNSNILFCISFK